MGVKVRMEQTIELSNIDSELKDIISSNYLFEDEKAYQLSKQKTRMGTVFEIIFKTLIENEGMKEGKDFLDLRHVRHRCIGIPDFYFIKAKTFVEIKSNCTTGTVFILETQKEKIKKMKEKGFDIKTLFFNVKILEDNMSLYTLLKQLVGII